MAEIRTAPAATSFASFANTCLCGEMRSTIASTDVFINSVIITKAIVSDKIIISTLLAFVKIAAIIIRAARRTCTFICFSLRIASIVPSIA